MSKNFIEIISYSMGDIIACLPVIEEYRKLTNNETVVKLNPKLVELVRTSYPNLIFDNQAVDNASEVKEIRYHFGNVNKPLQTGFAHELGFLEWNYIRPHLNPPTTPPEIPGKYVTFGLHSTAQAKYWNNSLGRTSQHLSPNWDRLGKLLKKDGYKPIIVDKYESFGAIPYFNNNPKSLKSKINFSFDKVVNFLYYSEFFVGISSGLSWVAHALGKPVVMISNFTEDWNEFSLQESDYLRITNKDVCHGCWNKISKDQPFDALDWYWCPQHKGTKREFECTKSIKPDYVYQEIKKWRENA